MLMGIIDGIRIGRSQLVDRAALEAFLRHLIEAADPVAELRAARRTLKQRWSRRLRVQLTPQVLATTFDSLPAGVPLTATRLSFEDFASAEEAGRQRGS